MTSAPVSSTAELSLRRRVIDEFARVYGRAPAIVARAPGRVNLIGDHTDYNDGFVLPMAIDRAVWIALTPRDGTNGRKVRVRSLDFDQSAELALDGLVPPAKAKGWAEYMRGVAWALADAGYATHGWDGVAAGDVPLGAGLSSSAALELATARAFATASGFTWEPATMARLAQRAENRWVGVNCGIMDQLISAAGEAGHALLIDCRSLETRAVPVPREVAVVVLDTATRRGLVDSAYNERRSQCEAAAHAFGVKALRDVDEATFGLRAGELDALTRRRARHVITENARTVAAADALARGDVRTVGRLMDESHASLRDDFAVSSPALDAMVRIARAHEGCHGARMTGAGFGGCAVALVDATAARAFSENVARGYESEVGQKPHVYVCSASQGASAEVLQGLGTRDSG